MKKILIKGIDISEFEIINSSLVEDLSILKDVIYRVSGVMLSEKKDNNLLDKHYIILDGSELIVDKYNVKFEDGNIIIKGSAHSLKTAIEHFCNILFTSDEKEPCYLTEEDSFEGSTAKKEIYTRDQLMAVIEKVYADKDHIIIGEQVCGNPKGVHNIAKSIKKFKNSTGEMPGIIGIDLACYGLDLANTDDVAWSSYLCDLVDYAADGGIITVSAHWANPSGNTMGGDPVRGKLGYEHNLEAYEKSFKELLTDGTEYNIAFKKELETDARFFKLLEANGIPVIWRPLHEANGDWFWYSCGLWTWKLDASYVVDIWHYIYKYFSEEQGIKNLIWCYAPNISANIENDPSEIVMSTTYLYPGDDYCDMVGVDWYSSGDSEIAMGNNYIKLVEHAKKPGAIAEFGTHESIMTNRVEDQPSVYSCMNLYEDLKGLIQKGHSFVYLITWYNRFDITCLGCGDEFMKTEMTLGQREVKALFDSLKHRN